MMNPRSLCVLLGGELRRFARDPMLVIFMAVGPFLALLARAAFDFGAPLLFEATGFDLSQYRDYVLVFVVQMPAPLIGMAGGFLILEDRDERLFAPLSMTPPGVGGYLGFRVCLLCLVGFLESLLVPALTGLRPVGGWFVGSLVGALGACPLAALYALLLGAVARNKLEGMSVGKALSVFEAGALLACVAPGLWVLPSAVLPTFGPAKALLSLGWEALAWLCWSLALNGALCAWAWKTCVRRARMAGEF